MSKNVAIMVGSLHGGGMEHVAAQLSVIFSDLGFNVYIFVGSFDKKKAYMYKGKVIIFPYTFLCSPSLRVKEFGLLLCDAYRFSLIKRKYVIDATVSFAPEMNLLNMISGIKDKKILTIHSCQSLRKDFQGFSHYRKIFKIYNYAYKVITVSNWCKQDLIKYYGIKKNRIKVIYNPVKILERPIDEKAKKNIILVVGRMHDIKQQWHIIRAFRKVLDEMSDAKLVIAGIGENYRYLRKLANEMDMANEVIFKGFVTEIKDLYNQAKVTVFSSASEALPCSVIESVAYGVPVVAADCPGGIREIIDQDNHYDKTIQTYTIVKCGVLVPEFDGKKYSSREPLTRAETEMANGILFLLKNESMRQILVKNCLKYRKSFDERRIANKWKKVIEEIV